MYAKCTTKCPSKCTSFSVIDYTYIGLSFIRGIGAHVKVTVRSKKGFLPHTSDNAPINGAARNDNIPWKNKEGYYQI